MKIDGLWTIEFISTLHLVGSGVVVLNDKRLLGGDEGYYYSGHYDTENGQFSGTIDVTRYNLKSLSVFGDIGQYTLKLEGQVQDYQIEGTAWMESNPNRQLRIVGTKKAEL
ncbi:MAG: hypothetical protein F4142_11150 [Nitrospira sp. SB0675_bin_23]|nr:hypothetical protein [Nitrospira sp. SB0661_bin_20]MYH03095.1 hypothetical protein [Nitrospira sp. SB0675_bin_23]MYJ23583.1 hypothetical protein [Nitrospira sp. SB0673_bin_12]